ncbi:hypothetical protein ACU8NH_24280 [Rhizobium leguminosarum]
MFASAANVVAAACADRTQKATTNLPNGMMGFETRYAEARRQKRQAKERRQQRSDYDETNDFAATAIEQKGLVRKRLEDGYKLHFGNEIAGRWREPFTEVGLRSEDNFILKYFVSLVPRGGRARASNDKANLAVQTRSKLLTLDYPYIELNREFMAALRVDCDGVFNSPDSCEAALREVVREGRIPCLPHIIVGDLLDNGTFARPHFIWMLPYGSAVWRSDDERCRKQPVKLFDAVARGLAAALLDLGADPAAPTMTGRMKCPTSPIWCTRTPNAEIWPTLAEYADYVDTSVDRAVLTRKAAAVQSELGLKASNKLFDALRTEGRRLLTEWHFGADVRMRGCRAALADHLQDALTAFANGNGLVDERAASDGRGKCRRDMARRAAVRAGYVAAKVADYLAAHFDATKLDRNGVNRGKLLDVVEGLETVKERQKAAGRYAGRAKGISTLKRLLDAFQQLQAAGETITQTAVAAASGISRRTVVARWGEVVLAIKDNRRDCENSCIDKKVGATPAPPDTANFHGHRITTAESDLVANDATGRQVAEHGREKQQTLYKADVLLRQAASDVRKHRHETGIRRHIGDVIERIARDNPDQPRLDAGTVLAMVERPAPLDDDLAAILETIEAMAQRQMVT